jgi:predicted RNase H-like nuclease (RuvC/YqgF family)
MDKRYLNPQAPAENIDVATLPTRVDKALQWLSESRDSWKDKTMTSKAKLKTTTLALKRSRERLDKCTTQLKREHCTARSELRQKDKEIEKLKVQLGQARQEVENLKKKNSLHTQRDQDGILIGVA